MKLLTRYNRINFVTTIFVLFITGGIYYWVISFILNHQIDKDIRFEENEISSYIKQNNKLPAVVDYKDQLITFSATSSIILPNFSDTTHYDKKEGEYDAARRLVTSVKVNGQRYKLLIIKSKVETDDLIKIIFEITIGVILVLLLILFITNRFILNRIWQPFYDILHQLRVFNLTDNSEIADCQSVVDEFKELNNAVVNMSSRVKTDYKDLKAFTENASHELLTPIAVINSKLDSLIQSGDYNELQSKLLTDVYGAVSRLTRLNQSLLLLVKIENRLVTDEQQVDLKLLVEEKINQFSELFLDKEITVFCDLKDKQLKVSRYLIEVLLNNLLNNAMRHNNKPGKINIMLNSSSLIIQNTGNAPALQDAEIFKRFNKSSNSDGTGLGLTISKQICDNYHYQLKYTYQNPYHIFTVLF